VAWCLGIIAWSLLIYPPGHAARGRSQERLSSNSNSALVLQAPVAIYISLQLLIAHISKVIHALALYALVALGRQGRDTLLPCRRAAPVATNPGLALGPSFVRKQIKAQRINYAGRPLAVWGVAFPAELNRQDSAGVATRDNASQKSWGCATPFDP
jgi:hypothetical protein